jgi:DNA-binding transcriptional ArsR family regulator
VLNPAESGFWQLTVLRTKIVEMGTVPGLDTGASASLYYLSVMELTGNTRTRHQRLDATFSALADPTRRAILARLATGPASVTELAEPFAMTQPAISKHLKVLERAGLISRGRDAQRRPCRLEAKRLAEANEWLEDYRKFWGESFERLDDLLDELKSKPHHQQGDH